MVMLAGTEATDAFELDRATTAPPVGAVWLSVAVPLAAEVATTVDGLTVSADMAGGAGVTVSVVVFVVPLYTAVIVTFVEEPTLEVVIANVAEDADGRTVAVPGTEATLGFELESATFALEAGAGPLRDTVPVEAVPPETLVGDTLTEVSTAGVTVSVAVFVPVE
jgi:hypothetical protein